MLGERDPQRSFFRAIARFGVETVTGLGFYGSLALQGSRVFRDEDFAEMYCADNGRPSVPPSMLAVARLLQHYEGISDADVIDRCRYELRWKIALDLDPDSLEAPFARSTFQAFRARLTLHAKEGAAFERSVRLAGELGLLPEKMCVALDSSPVRGRGAVKDTFCLLSDAIAGVIRGVARQQQRTAKEVAEEAGLGRHIVAPSIKGSEAVEWSNEEDVSRFLDGLLEDSERAVALASAAECANAEVELLRKIIAQDVERPAAGKPAKIRRGVAPDRTPSVADPEMRHGRKSSGKVYAGHKAHVAVEQTSGVITAVDMGAPGEGDGAKVGDLIRQSQQVSGCEVEQAIGDCAYGCEEPQKQAQGCGVPLTTKMPGPPTGRFGPGDFQVSPDGSEATCPAGHQSAKHYQQKDGILHVWSPGQCETCPLRERCTTATKRQLRVPANFHDRRRREQYARSEEGRALLRLRVVVEHSIGRIKNLGAGTARYFGRAKTKAQWLWTAAVANLSLIWATTALSTT
jgi:hypothetical protein